MPTVFITGASQGIGLAFTRARFGLCECGRKKTKSIKVSI
jgi:short-subunit dehydrogenase